MKRLIIFQKVRAIHPTAKKLLTYHFIAAFLDRKIGSAAYKKNLQQFEKEFREQGIQLEDFVLLSQLAESSNPKDEFFQHFAEHKMGRRGFMKAAAAGLLGFTWLGKKANAEEAPKPVREDIPSAPREKQLPTTLSLAYNLHSILNNTPRVKLVRQPIFSQLDNSPIIIIIEDIHDMSNPKENWIGDASQIMAIKFILEMELGIRDWVLGIEGWVGEKVEKERGYKVNRKKKHPVWDLLAALKSKKNISVIGIEDPYYHEMVIKFMAVEYDDIAINWENMAKIRGLPAESVNEMIQSEKEDSRKILEEINVIFSQQTIAKARAEFDSLLLANGLISKDEQEDFVLKELEKERVKFFKEAEGKLEVEKYRFMELHPDMDSQAMDNQLKLLESSIKGKAKERWLKVEQVLKEYLPKKYLKDRRTNAPVEITCFVAERSQKSAEIMAVHIKDNNLRAGVMFYGAGHTPSLLEALQKLGDFSIFVVK